MFTKILLHRNVLSMFSKISTGLNDIVFIKVILKKYIYVHIYISYIVKKLTELHAYV